MQKQEPPISDKVNKDNSAPSNPASLQSTPQNSVNGGTTSVGNNSGRGKRGSGRGGVGRGGQGGRNSQGNSKNGNGVGRFQRNANHVGQNHSEKKWEDNSHGNGHQKLSEVRQSNKCYYLRISIKQFFNMYTGSAVIRETCNIIQFNC
jgi:hypothetical protein